MHQPLMALVWFKSSWHRGIRFLHAPFVFKQLFWLNEKYVFSISIARKIRLYVHVQSSPCCCWHLMPKLLQTHPLWRALDGDTSGEWFRLFEFVLEDMIEQCLLMFSGIRKIHVRDPKWHLLRKCRPRVCQRLGVDWISWIIRQHTLKG